MLEEPKTSLTYFLSFLVGNNLSNMNKRISSHQRKLLILKICFLALYKGTHPLQVDTGQLIEMICRRILLWECIPSSWNGPVWTRLPLWLRALRNIGDNGCGKSLPSTLGTNRFQAINRVKPNIVKVVMCDTNISKKNTSLSTFLHNFSTNMFQNKSNFTSMI